MSNYMPDTEEIRNRYASPSWVTAAQEAERYGEFDAWLKEIRADAIVNYLREWADELGPHSLYSKWDIHTMIRNRIKELRKQEEA